MREDTTDQDGRWLAATALLVLGFSNTAQKLAQPEFFESRLLGDAKGTSIRCFNLKL